MIITGDVVEWVVHFLLFVVRMSALFIVSPIFGRNNIPAYVKVLLSVILAFIAIQMFPPAPGLPPTILHFVFTIFGELLIGLIIGYVTTMFFSVVFTAGNIIDTQIGFGMVQIYDVATNAQMPVAGTLMNSILLICVLLSNGHIKLIRLLFATFEYIPVGHAAFRPEIGTLMLNGFVTTFILSVNVAIPLVASALVAEVGLGIVVRTSPQMNIFVIGIPLKTLLGLIMLGVVLPVFIRFTNIIFERMYEFINTILPVMQPG
ncbi:MAG: flagellar biosynthetic protein FliR [Oscillospiraceae bacterium]|nr:flagellar biosynthetic protein FliR [Oscillospiraceae bacterium]